MWPTIINKDLSLVLNYIFGKKLAYDLKSAYMVYNTLNPVLPQ